MTYRTLTTLLHSEGPGTDTLEASVGLARRLDAHLSVVLGGVNTVDPGMYYAGVNTAMIATALGEADQKTKEMSDRLTDRMRREEVSWDEIRAVASGDGVGQALAEQARFGDLTVLPQPYGKSRVMADVAAVESALLETGVPVLILPAGTNEVAMPRRILLGWDQGQPAMAATRGALPFLAQAEEVVICVIDPPRRGIESADPGGTLATFLSRHGAKARISVMPSSGGKISDILLAEAKSQGSDMVVMGGYGHSRIREYVLGGTTRRILEQSLLPVLMAH